MKNWNGIWTLKKTKTKNETKEMRLSKVNKKYRGIFEINSKSGNIMNSTETVLNIWTSASHKVSGWESIICRYVTKQIIYGNLIECGIFFTAQTQ